MIDGIAEVGVHQLLPGWLNGAPAGFEGYEDRIDSFEQVRIFYLERPARLLLVIHIEEPQAHRRLAAILPLSPRLERSILHSYSVEVICVENEALPLREENPAKGARFPVRIHIVDIDNMQVASTHYIADVTSRRE